MSEFHADDYNLSRLQTEGGGGDVTFVIRDSTVDAEECDRTPNARDALQGSVDEYDAPFEPVVEPDSWKAVRRGIDQS